MKALAFAMAKDMGFTNATFLPGLFSSARVEECFTIEKEFGAVGADYFLRCGKKLGVGMTERESERKRARE